MHYSELYYGYSPSRIWELDFVRGFCIVLMIADHALYDLAYIFWHRWFSEGDGAGILFLLSRFARTTYYPLLLRDIAWWIAVFCFIFICGISCSFSHSNLKRGIRLAAVAVVLSLATFLLDNYQGYEDQLIIRFGVLHMLASSILLYCILRKTGVGFMLLTAVLTIAAGFYFMNTPIEGTIKYVGVLATTAGFYSADYFPLMPWFGFFLLGAALGPIIYVRRKSLFPQQNPSLWKRPFFFVGRHSLAFYIFHQPVVYGILYLTGEFLNK